MSEELSTDDEILNAIGEGGSSEEATTTQEDSNDQTAADVIETAQTNNTGEVIGQSNEAKSGEQQTRGPQDLVDAQGNVIASGGKERRFYEQAQRAKHEVQQATNRVQELEGQLQAINDAGNAGAQYNLTPDEVTTGVQMMAAFKENPVETVKYMLTQAQSLGHNVEGLTGATDMASIKGMINEAVSPLVQEQQEKIDAQQNLDQAQQIYDGFISKYPDAQPHENSLARLLESDNSLSPEAAYFKLKSFYLEKNLDFNKPLEVLQQEETARKQTPVAGNTQSTVPTGGIPATNVTDTETIAEVGTSMDDIIKQSMADAGMNYN